MSSEFNAEVIKRQIKGKEVSLNPAQEEKIERNEKLRKKLVAIMRESSGTEQPNKNEWSSMIKGTINTFVKNSEEERDREAAEQEELAALEAALAAAEDKEREEAAKGGKRKTRKSHRKSRKTHRKSHRKTHRRHRK
jgi:hypothetical protein